MKYYEYLIEWIKEEVEKAGMDGVIVGLSGGVDSSVVATLAKKAFPNSSLGVYLPVGDMGQDLIDAKLAAKAIGIETTSVDLTEAYEVTAKAVGTKTKLATANIKPRLRMTALYALAQEKRYLVLGTDNAAEWILGYFTKYGDGGVDLLPIVHLTKGEVKAMAKEFKLPEIIYTKAPTAALWDGQTDEDELGYSYDEVDKVIKGERIDPETKMKIDNQIRITEHKRLPLPTPKSQETYKVVSDIKEIGDKIKGFFK